jgi:hypothetical protein
MKEKYILSEIKIIFVELAFNLSNAVIDIIESSSILIYSKKHMSLYRQNVGRMPYSLNS